MYFNKLIEWYRFPVLLLLVDAGSCKNERAAAKIDLMLKKQAQKHSNAPHATTIGQDTAITAKGNSEKCPNHTPQMAASHPDENSKDYSKQRHEVEAQPSFTLKDITTKAGRQGAAMLEATGITEGYSIKSIAIVKNNIYHTKTFGVNKLQNKPIPAAGLPIPFTTDPRLQTGLYLLNIKIGKTGKNSRQTEQWATCNIHVVKDEAKNEKKTDPKQNHTTPTEPIFTLKDLTIQAGTQQSTMLATDDATQKYSIKSISVSQNKSYYTNKFGVDALKNSIIPAAGLPVSLTPDRTLKTGSYKLKIKIGKLGKVSDQTEQWAACTIHVVNNTKNSPLAGKAIGKNGYTK